MLRSTILILLLIWPLSAFGAEPVPLDVEVNQSGQAYRDAASGVNHTVTYYDPTAPAPEMVISEPFDLETADTSDDALSLDGPSRIVFSIIIIAVL
ncbi:MAG: hypothetical protein P8Q23_08275, partial [Paracoccaceae bacterium]|nr:hypothetical protein [Paracoccaceae bacterium]